MSPFQTPDVVDDPVDLPEPPRRAGAVDRDRLVAHALAADVARRHGEALLRTARRHSRNADDAHDAYQRALERLLLHAASIDRAKVVAWMHVVVRREALLVRRAEGPATVPLDADDVDDALHRFATQPDEHLHAIDLAQRAGEALATLKEAEAQALCLRAQGMSYEEIASTYGWSYTKVNRAVTEGRRAFVDHYTAVERGAVCDATAEYLPGYVDGTLRPALALKVRAHLVRCSACRSELHAQRGAEAALRALLPPALIAVAAERSGRAPGWLSDHILAPLGHVAGKLQPAADGLLGSKIGVAAAATVAIAGGGVAAQQATVDRGPAPQLGAGVTGTLRPVATTTPGAPPGPAARSGGVLGQVVDRAASNTATAARVQARAAARRKARAERRRKAKVAAKARARARAKANANEFAGGVSEFDTTTRASTARAATATGSAPAASPSSGSRGGGTAPSPDTAGTAAGPEIEVPAETPADSPSIDVTTEP